MPLRPLACRLLCLAALLPIAAGAQTITTVAGNGGTGNTGNGGQATSAETGYPVGVLADRNGGYFIGGNSIVRHVGADGRISVFAGDGIAGYSGDGGMATAARFRSSANALALGPDGSLYLGDVFVVRKVDPAGIISTVASLAMGVTSLAFDPAGNLYIGGGCTVTRMDPHGSLTRVAGTGQCGASAGDAGPATAATLTGNIYGVAVDAGGRLWLSDPDAQRIRRVGTDGVIATATTAVSGPMMLSAAANGDVYAVDRTGYVVIRLDPDGVVTDVAGMRYHPGFAGDGGPATAARLDLPWAAAVDSGRLLIADTLNHRIRSVGLDIAPIPAPPATTCASEGYTGTKLLWCQNICEKGHTGPTLALWIRRWTDRYRDLPYCAAQPPSPPPD